MIINRRFLKFKYVVLLISTTYLINFSNTYAQTTLVGGNWYEKKSKNLTFSPNTIITIPTKNSGQKSIFRLGSDMDFSYFIAKNLSIGIGLHYSHFFQKGGDINVLKTKLFAEYFFMPKKKISPYIGIRIQNTIFQYTTDDSNFLYFNDQLTFEKKIHNYLNQNFYIGIDWKLNKRIAIGLNIGTGFLYIPKNKNGTVPDLTPWTIYPTFKWKL